jgi:MFS transporter, PAT family, beta-lactamase induction signal transducer AmpG
MFLGGISATVLSGMLANATGYTFVFIASTVVNLLSVHLISINKS